MFWKIVTSLIYNIYEFEFNMSEKSIIMTWFMIGDIIAMICEQFHMKYHLGMTAN